jgi:hypothetical protein
VKTAQTKNAALDIAFFTGNALVTCASQVAKLHPATSSEVASKAKERYRSEVAITLATEAFRDNLVLEKPFDALKAIACNAPPTSLYIGSIAAVFTGFIHKSSLDISSKTALFNQLRAFRDTVLASECDPQTTSDDSPFKSWELSDTTVAIAIAKSLDEYFKLQDQNPETSLN